ncbi:outer membrane protein assembly factor BamA [Palleronia rufa]|uniref:outer membrane protein assembly factor BamA n=1 Tax=Palleronia rufa TaxID=1530186 RepID=UPI00069204C6|nr:outer membrane protein assembly factor BamA [Palleronia rufa]
MQTGNGRFARGVGLAALMRSASMFGCLAVGLAVVPTVVQAQTFQFNQVAVRGNDRVATGTVLGALAIQPGQALSAGDLNAAYQRVVGLGLFETVALEPQGGTLIVTVAEWPTVQRISIEGNSRIGDEELADLIGSVPNRVYNPSQAEADARAIAAAYEQRGRLAATVVPRIIRRDANQVDLVFEVAEGRVVEIERLSFVGNRAYSDRRLRRALATKQAGILRQLVQRDTFVADRLDLDRQLLTDFYQSRGYIDFRVESVTNEFSRERSAFFVQFNVQEGQSWEFGRVTASTNVAGVNAQDYLAVAQIRPGETYSPRAVDNAVARMERLATQRGLTFIRATPQIERDGRNLRLDMNFLIERGPRIFVERIDIEGNQSTLDRVIRRQFRTVEGDPFNPREIRAASERIRALGYFADAQVETREGTSPDRVIVDVDVEEQPTGSLSFGGSYSTDSGVGVNVGFSERNFLGRGQFLAVNVATGTDANSASLTFGEPAFLGRDLNARIELFYRTTDFDQADYNTRSVGISPSLSFPISENGRLTLSYRLAEDKIFDVTASSSPILQRDDGTAITSALGYSYTYDNRRSGLDINSGVVLRFGQDFAGLGGDITNVETTALAGYQTQVYNEEITLRATIEGGAVNSLDGQNTRITDRYFLSSRQMRGFEPLGLGPRDLAAPNQDALGGNYYAVARLEAEFPLGLPEEYGLRGGLFFDAGSVWGLDDTSGFDGVEVDDSFKLRSAVGISLLWDSPLGPLRFNWAETLQAEEFDNTRSFNVTLSTEF